MADKDGGGEVKGVGGDSAVGCSMDIIFVSVAHRGVKKLRWK